MENPEIYVACLASYNSGVLHGRWIDATQSEDAIMDEIQEMLQESPVGNAEEWAVHDYQCFGEYAPDEYCSISEIVSIVRFIEEHGMVGSALLANYDLADAETMMRDYYHGCFDSEVDFAEQLFDECYVHEIPDNLRFYIDYEAFARDLFINDYCSVDVRGETHVFSIY